MPQRRVDSAQFERPADMIDIMRVIREKQSRDMGNSLMICLGTHGSIASVKSSTISGRTKLLICKRLLPSLNPPHAQCRLNCHPWTILTVFRTGPAA